MLPEMRNENIEMYGSEFKLLEEVLNGIPEDAMKFKPEPKEWSIHEVIIHLADSEAIAAQQARLMVAEPGKQVMVYDADEWANNLNYHEQDRDEALQLLRLTRSFTYRWLKSLPEKAFELSAAYPGEEEPYVLDDLIFIYAKHIKGHVEQIKNNLKLWQTRK